jgi:hypothetical protein
MEWLASRLLRIVAVEGLVMLTLAVRRRASSENTITGV